MSEENDKGGEWWEESFNKEIVTKKLPNGYVEILEHASDDLSVEVLKDFIRSVLSRERERLAKGVESMKCLQLIDPRTGDPVTCKNCIKAYNEAFEDASFRIRLNLI